LSAPALERLERRRARLARRRDRERRRAALLGRLRVVAFLVAVGLLAAVVPLPERAAELRLGALASLLAFSVVVRLHRGPRSRERHLDGVLEAVDRDVLRASGRWAELPRTGAGLAGEAPRALDLGIVGRWSLFRALSRAATPFGERCLARVLVEGAAPDTVPGRQAAVRELAARSGLRHRLEAEGARGRIDGTRPSRLVGLLRSRPSVHDGRAWLAPVAGLLVLATVVQGLFLLGTGRALAVWPCLAAQVALFLVTRRQVEAEYAELLPHEGALVAWTGMLGLLESHRFRSARLRRLHAQVSGASEALSRLNGTLGWLTARLTMMHPLLNVFGLWDLLLTRVLAGWRGRHGERVAGWFEALGEWEAAASLGGHASQQERPVFAELAPHGPAWSARAAAHPLLPPGSSVPNDVELAGPGTVLLLTGSNMSGKSTLLRTVGLNTVLAQAGAAVHAESLRLRPCRLETSIHVTDALDAGVSLFHAEVRRLKEILDAVDAADADPAVPPVLFLVDEILRGTNTRERLIAGRAVIRRLAASRSAGLVTSHELGLSELEEELPSLRNVHFRENVGPEGMTFDYRMREGPVTTSNAIAVLRQEGIDLDFDADR
jgi:hypothetical protein